VTHFWPTGLSPKSSAPGAFSAIDSLWGAVMNLPDLRLALIAALGLAMGLKSPVSTWSQETRTDLPDVRTFVRGTEPGQLVTTWDQTLVSGANTVAPHARAPLTRPVEAVAAASNAFAFDLFGEMRSTNSNKDLLVSPLSVSTALAMTYAGARGTNAAQMAGVLHVDALGDDAHVGFGDLLNDLNTPREGYELSVANRLFVRQYYDLRQVFLDRMADDYRAPVEPLDFKEAPEPSREHINRWVEEQTHDRIKNLLPGGSISRETQLVLTNALYFNGKWRHQFEEHATHDAPFYRSDGTMAPAPTMFQQQNFKRGHFGNYQMLEMPYAGDDLSMVIVLPTERDGLAAVEESMTAESFQANVESLETQRVNVFLPKFSFRDEAKLKRPLTDLGMTEAFTGGDFSGMGDGRLAIDEVFHKTFIEVDESGTEAAAATAIVVVTTTHTLNPPPPIEFRADHPFLFALRDMHTGVVMFLGRMTDPVAATAAANLPEPPTSMLSMTLAAAAAFARPRRRRGRQKAL
jgi:serpin B